MVPRAMAADLQACSEPLSFQGLIIAGNMGAAKSAKYLKKTGVTHVLNSAEGTRIGTVNATQEFYDPFGIKYKGLKLLDTPQSNIAVYFEEVAVFIGMVKNKAGT